MMKMSDLARDKSHCLFILVIAMLTLVGSNLLAKPHTLDDIRHLSFNYRVDVNTADYATLRLLPGVGAVTAQYIVDHRQTHGSFANPDDLIAVPRLGPKTVARMLPYLIFETQATTRHN